SRLRDFDPAVLEDLLLEREAVRMTLMRTTLHLVTAADARRLRVVMQDVCERGFKSSPFQRQIEGLSLPELLDAGTEIVEARPRASGSGPGCAIFGPMWPASGHGCERIATTPGGSSWTSRMASSRPATRQSRSASWANTTTSSSPTRTGPG